MVTSKWRWTRYARGALDYIVKSPEAFTQMPHAVERTLRAWEELKARQRAQEALRVSEERLRLILEAVRMGTFDFDLITNRIAWSRRHEEIWGMQPGEFSGTYEAFLSRVHPEDRASIQTEWERCISSRSPFCREYRVVWPDESVHWVEGVGEFTFDASGRPIRLRGTVVDTTQRRQAERFHALSAEILTLLNEEVPGAKTTQRILDAIKRETGLDAVGARLRAGDDFPYLGSAGFSADFLQAENSLVLRTVEGGLCRDEHGNVPLECTCGLVLSGKVDACNPLFTPGGSAWTNDARSFLDRPASQDPRLHPRNRCVHEGYQSVALIPIRVNQENIGLLQLNDRRKGCFTLEVIRFFEGMAASFGVALLRQREEQQLRESERNLRSLFDVVAEPVFLMDRNGLVLAANATFAARLHRRVEECVGRRIYDFLSPQVASRRQAWAEEAVRTRRVVTHEDEREGHWLRHSIYPVVGEDGTVKRMVVFAVDITESRRAAEVLRESEERYRNLVETSFDWVWEVDAQGRYTYASPRVRALLGYEPKEVLGMTPFELMPEPEAKRVGEIFGELVEARESFSGLVNINRHKNGQLVVLETSGVPVLGKNRELLGYRGMDRDVTERMQAEAALKASEERFRTLVAGAPIGIYVQTGGKFAYVNQTAVRLFGVASPEDLLGQPILDRFHPEHRTQVSEYVRRLNEDRQPVVFAEDKCLRPDGTAFEAEFTRVPFVFDGQPGGLVFFRDVTDRKRLESQLRQAQKLDAIGQLAGGVAHDFNNILAGVMLHLGLMQVNQRLDEETHQALQDLDSEVRRAASLTRQLLMFSRRSVLAVKPLDLNEIVTNLLKMLSRLIGEHIDLRFEGKAGLPLVTADAGMLDQVLMNLVVNARDAMPKGGRINICNSVVERAEADIGQDSARQAGRFVCLTVSDTGTGMDEATLKRIFEPFFTTKEPGKGTGLGLATVHGIVAQHKGWVEVESQVGRGTTFRVFLPIAAQTAVELAPVAPAVLQRGRETILLVEDDRKVLQMVGQTLRVLGYRVFEAANGQEAMQVWLTHGEEVDLLLTDMVMPEGMTGLELTERLQAMRPDLKAIISSGYSAEIVQAGVPDKAGIVYLPKPYQTQRLAEMVRKCLDQRSDRKA